MLQAVGSAPPQTIDLTIRQPCPAPSPGEIVVCAGQDDGRSPYRIQPTPPPSGSAIPKAETQLADGVAAAVETESHDVGGFPSKRAMVRLKIKF